MHRLKLKCAACVAAEDMTGLGLVQYVVSARCQKSSR